MATVVADTIEDTQVLIGGVAAPILYRFLHPDQHRGSVRRYWNQRTSSGALSGAAHRIHYGAGSTRVTRGVFHGWQRRRPGSDPQPGRQRQLANQSRLARLGGGAVRHRRGTHHACQCRTVFSPRAALPGADASRLRHHRRPAGSRSCMPELRRAWSPECCRSTWWCPPMQFRHPTIRWSSRSAITPAQAP